MFFVDVERGLEMAYRNKKKENELEKIQKWREATVYKTHTMLQKARYNLNLMEQRIVHYAIAQIKPTSTVSTEFIIDLNDLFDICGLTHESYTEIKMIIKSLSDRSWWIVMEDPNFPGTECDSLVRWFNTLRSNKKTGKVTIKFHEDMFNYLFSLYERYRQYGENYAGLVLKYTLPMKSKYGLRLYELLKSYQINNEEWWFQVDNLKHLLNCDNYKTYKDFRVRVLEPAVEEINKFTDIKIEYEAKKEGKKVDKIIFYMEEKSTSERIQAEKDGLTKLEGKIHYWDNVIPGQLNFFDEVEEQ
jgi:plasmid replication initiation protein